VATLLAERGVRVDPSSIDAGVQAFAPPDADAARACRRAVGARWRVDETDVTIAGEWASMRMVYHNSYHNQAWHSPNRQNAKASKLP